MRISLAGHEPWQHSNDYLYHYTDTGGLIGILSNTRIWLTNAGFLNDTEELSFGASEASELLQEKAAETESIDGASDTNLAVANSLRRMSSSIETISAPDGPSFEFPFVASFSQARDNLSQWRGYSANGGYCIAFHKKTLQKYLVPADTESFAARGSNIPSLRPVNYGLQAREYLREEVETFKNALLDLPNRSSSDDSDTYYLVKHLLKPALVLTKHPAFQAEQEWRIYQIDPIAGVKFRSSPLGPVPFTEVTFLPEAVAEVMVSPGDSPHRRKRAAEELLKHYGYTSTQVTLSSAPFVG